MSFAPRGKSGGVRGAQGTGPGCRSGNGTQALKQSKNDGVGAAMDEFDDKGLPGPAITCSILLGLLILTAFMVGGFIWLLFQLGH